MTDKGFKEYFHLYKYKTRVFHVQNEINIYYLLSVYTSILWDFRQYIDFQLCGKGLNPASAALSAVSPNILARFDR